MQIHVACFIRAVYFNPHCVGYSQQALADSWWRIQTTQVSSTQLSCLDDFNVTVLCLKSLTILVLTLGTFSPSCSYIALKKRCVQKWAAERQTRYPAFDECPFFSCSYPSISKSTSRVEIFCKDRLTVLDEFSSRTCTTISWSFRGFYEKVEWFPHPLSVFVPPFFTLSWQENKWTLYFFYSV